MRRRFTISSLSLALVVKLKLLWIAEFYLFPVLYSDWLNLDFILQVFPIETQTQFAAGPQISCIFAPLDTCKWGIKQEEGMVAGYL